MKFGIFDHMEFRNHTLRELYDERLDMLEYADRAGFWCYHKAEHHFIRLDAAPSGSVFLAAASQRTHQIRLGSLVFLLPFYDPIRLIEEVCMLDHLSGGRLEVGVGKGISPAEHTLWGEVPETARERFEETFAILRAGLTSQTLTFEGHRHTYHDAPLPHQPLQTPHPGFWYPGNVEYAAKHRLSTITGGPAAAIKAAKVQFEQQLNVPAEDWNPGVETPMIGATRHIYVAQTREAARARIESAYPAYHNNLATLFKKYDVPFPSGDPSLGGDFTTALRIGALVAGTVEDVIAHIQSLSADTGVTYLIFSFAWGDLTHEETMASLRLFAEEVMPAFAK